MTIERRRGRDFGLSADCISKQARKVVEILQKAGYSSYIVGGGVRDLLLNKQPKDFDIATAAYPEKIRRLFRRCRLVGKRFKLAHVFQGDHLLEVATFRASRSDKINKHFSVKKWCVIADNRYGTLEEDLIRRDFTVNAMYYDPFSDELICHPKALSDLENKCLRIIGDPQQRYREDPVRMLRGVRLATKLDLNLEKEAQAQIVPNRNLLLNIPSARMFEECKKLFCCGASHNIFQQLKHLRLFNLLFPQTADLMNTHPKAKAFERFLGLLFSNTDARIAVAAPVTPAFVIAGLWWLPIYSKVGQCYGKRLRPTIFWEQNINRVAALQRTRIAIPRYILNFIYEIYRLQPYFTGRRIKDINYLISARRFRAAYDFFYLLSEAGLADMDDCKWWEKFQQVDRKQRNTMISDRTKTHTKTKPTKRVKLSA